MDDDYIHNGDSISRISNIYETPPGIGDLDLDKSSELGITVNDANTPETRVSLSLPYAKKIKKARHYKVLIQYAFLGFFAGIILGSIAPVVLLVISYNSQECRCVIQNHWQGADAPVSTTNAPFSTTRVPVSTTSMPDNTKISSSTSSTMATSSGSDSTVSPSVKIDSTSAILGTTKESSTEVPNEITNVDNSRSSVSTTGTDTPSSTDASTTDKVSLLTSSTLTTGTDTTATKTNSSIHTTQRGIFKTTTSGTSVKDTDTTANANQHETTVTAETSTLPSVSQTTVFSDRNSTKESSTSSSVYTQTTFENKNSTTLSENERGSTTVDPGSKVTRTVTATEDPETIVTSTDSPSKATTVSDLSSTEKFGWDGNGNTNFPATNFTSTTESSLLTTMTGTTSNSDVQTQSPLLKGGATYVRWGRTTCSEPGTRMIYQGFAAGGHYLHSGPVNTLCLPETPTWGKYDDAVQGDRSILYGTEYETDVTSTSGDSVRDHDVPCVVCQASGRFSHWMIPARTQCYEGWTLEYSGYLMGEKFDHNHASEVICVDSEPETIIGGRENKQGNLLYPVEVREGALPSPPYIQGRELGCVVCTQ